MRRLEMLVQESQDRPVDLDPVLLLGEAVPLIGEDDVLDWDAALFQRGDDVIRFRLDDPRPSGNQSSPMSLVVRKKNRGLYPLKIGVWRPPSSFLRT
jgi:hypothetical protein